MNTAVLPQSVYLQGGRADSPPQWGVNRTAMRSVVGEAETHKARRKAGFISLI
jgi:hypothetical protein